MKVFAIFSATILAIVGQVCLIGINGLTLYSVPITLFLGIKVLEKLTEQVEPQEQQDEQIK